MHWHIISKVIWTQSPPGRIYGDSSTFCKVGEETIRKEKKGAKKVTSLFFGTISISKWVYLGYQKAPPYIFSPIISWRISQIGLLTQIGNSV